MKKTIHTWQRVAAVLMLAVMVFTLIPLPVAAMMDISDITTHPVPEIVDITELISNVAQSEEAQREDDVLPEISVSPEPPAIAEPTAEEDVPNSQPEPSSPPVSSTVSQPVPEPVPGSPPQAVKTQNKAVLMASDGSVRSSSATQKLQLHASYQYYHVFQKRVVKWSSATIDGKLAYCVDLTTFHSTEGINMGSSTVYNSLTTDQKYALGHVLQYGSKDISNVPYYIATQTLVWEVVHGRMNLETWQRTNSDIYDGIAQYTPQMVPYYDQILNAVKQHEMIPSFMTRTQSGIPTHRITGTGSDFDLELTNANTAFTLSDFHFSSVDGVTLTLDGQTLKIHASRQLLTPVLVRAYKGATGQTDTVLFWSNPGSNQQVRATPLETNPVPAYMYLATNDIGGYSIEINKLESGTNRPLEGAVFQVRHTENGIVGNMTSGPDGTAMMNVPWKGTYIVTELTPPKNHMLDEHPSRDVIVSTEHQNASITFTNKPYTGLRVLKVDAANSRPLAGAVIAIEQINGSIRLEDTTDKNGEVFFDSLPPDSSWRIVEQQAPSGYQINTQVFTAQLVENQIATVTIPDKVKSGLVIRKVDSETGAPLVGALFTVTRSDGKLIGEYLSDENGLVVVDSLPEDTYIVEEVQPPEGYLLDGKNSKKTVRLTWENNQELVFRDHAKPKLQIKKVDKTTGVPLKGAVIRIAKRGGSEYTDVTTGEDGTALLENLETEWYQVQEIKSPEGYLLDDSIQDVELQVGKTASIVLVNQQEPALRIQKIKAEDGSALAGAVFRIALPSGATQDVTTGVDGMAELTGLDVGDAVVQEIKSPDGYLLDDTQHHIRLEAGKTAEIIVKNSQKPSLMIRKIDSITGDPMAGVKFSVSVKNGKPLGEYITDANGGIFLSGVECDLTAGTLLVVREVSTLDGYVLDQQEKEVLLEADKVASVQFENQPLNPILIKKVDPDGKPLSGVTFRVKRADGQYVGEYTTGISGLAVVAGQQPGFFIVEEIRTAEGYLLDNAPKTVQLKVDKPAEVEFINQKASTLLIKKINSVDGSPLSGAVFKVTASNGALLGEVTTGYNGYAILDGLEPQTVIVSEIKGPDGFILDETPHTVVLKKGATAAVEIENTPTSLLEIQKVDSVTGQPLAGVTFEVEKLSGERVGKFVTDAAGRIVIPGLTEQWLVIRETETVKGYRLDSAPVNVEVKAGKTTVVKLKNQPYPVLNLLKVDAETGKAMAGVKFKLFDSTKKELGIFTTNEGGNIMLTGINGDTTIYLQETETNPGYVLDTKLYPVTLQWGKTSTVTVKNQKIYGQLELFKVAADPSVLAKVQEKAPLAGAVFEIYDAKGKVVDTLTTDEDGYAISKLLPMGKYTGKEISAPKFFLPNGKVFGFEITEHHQVIKATVKDESKKPDIGIEKRGNVQAQPGQTMQYTLSNIRNQSNCALDEFYLEDVLPTDAVRLGTIHTGTYNEILEYKVTYQTNLTSDYRVLADGLSTQVNNSIACTPAKLGLAANEYITTIRFEFGTVQVGFANKDNPVLEVSVLPDLLDGHRILNSVTISGKCDGVPIYDKDTWITIIVREPDRPLPKTGVWESIMDN